MKLWLSVLFAILFLLGCNGEKPMLSPVSQKAAVSGGINISGANRHQFIVEIQKTAAEYGLKEKRDHDLETGLASSEHREIYSAHFVKNHRIGFFLSNDISETRFSYMLFKEPFDDREYVRFSQEINAIIQKYEEK